METRYNFSHIPRDLTNVRTQAWRSFRPNSKNWPLVLSVQTTLRTRWISFFRSCLYSSYIRYNQTNSHRATEKEQAKVDNAHKIASNKLHKSDLELTKQKELVKSKRAEMKSQYFLSLRKYCIETCFSHAWKGARSNRKARYIGRSNYWGCGRFAVLDSVRFVCLKLQIVPADHGL